MKNNGNALNLMIPKGSLQEATVKLFKESGWPLRFTSERDYFPTSVDPDINFVCIRSQELTEFVGRDSKPADVALVGWDWFQETLLAMPHRKDIKDFTEPVVICDLEYSKETARKAQWVLLVRKDSPIKRLEDCERVVMSTEFTYLTKKLFADLGVDIETVFSWGGDEAKISLGLRDASFELIETRKTLLANKQLRVVGKPLFETYVVMIAHPSALQDPKKEEKIREIAYNLKSRLHAMSNVFIEMNVLTDKIKAVSKLINGLKAPDIIPLFDEEEWSALRTIVNIFNWPSLKTRLMETGFVDDIVEVGSPKSILSARVLETINL